MRDYCYKEGENVYNVILTQIIEVVVHYGAWVMGVGGNVNGGNQREETVTL